MPFQGKPVPGAKPIGGFLAYVPPKYANEAPANVSWDGGALSRVPTTAMYAHPALEPKVQALIEGTWKFTTPKEGAKRGRIQIGAQGMGRGQAAGQVVGRGPALGVAPAFHAASPIKFDPLLLSSPGPLQHVKQAVPNDWHLMRDIPRVSAFTFRGDTRNPNELKQFNGFQPPISRTDDAYIKNVIYPTFKAYLTKKLGAEPSLTEEELKAVIKKTFTTAEDRQTFAFYSMWRAQAERESMHIGRMLAQEDLKGYISTTKASPVAKGFSIKREGITEGWVYVCLVESGFLVPSRGAHAWTHIFGEEEIASPQSIPWSHIMGFRKVNKASRLFDGPMFFRDTFVRDENVAFQQMYRLLGGFNQQQAAAAPM